MTVNEALQNIDVVVAAARMSRPEHDALRESLEVVAQRCQRADELEQERGAGKAKSKKKEIEENGGTDK